MRFLKTIRRENPVARIKLEMVMDYSGIIADVHPSEINRFVYTNLFDVTAQFVQITRGDTGATCRGPVKVVVERARVCRLTEDFT